MIHRLNDIPLSVRAANMIQLYWSVMTDSDWSVVHNPTVEEVRSELLSLRLNPKTCRGYGNKTHAELCVAVGVYANSATKINIKPNWKFNPMTGESLSQSKP